MADLITQFASTYSKEGFPPGAQWSNLLILGSYQRVKVLWPWRRVLNCLITLFPYGQDSFAAIFWIHVMQ